MDEAVQFLKSDVVEEAGAPMATSDYAISSSKRIPWRLVVWGVLLSAAGGGATFSRWRSPNSNGEASSAPTDAIAAYETGIFGNGFCGVTANPHICPELNTFFTDFNTTGADNILCKSNMGQSQCEMSVEMRCWESKDPSFCLLQPRIFWLWNVGGSMNADPTGGLADDPLCGGPGLPVCTQWAATAWMDYVDKWRPKLVAARSSGLKVTSPTFGGDTIAALAAFFTACPECNQVDSPYYIDILTFTSGLGAEVDRSVGVAAIKDKATKMKAAYNNRPVILASVWIGAATAASDADAIMNSGLFDRAGNSLDAFYWSVYPNSAFSSPDARTCLTDLVLDGPHKGNLLGKVLLDKCGPQR